MDGIDQPMYRLILESLPIGLVVVNRHGKVTLWNSGAERITGYLRQDVLGRAHTDEFLQHVGSGDHLVGGASLPLVETLREGRPIISIASLRAKSGRFVPVRLHTLLLRDEANAILGAVEIFDQVGAEEPFERRHSKLAAFGCIDSLTGLLNHGMIQARLRETLSLYAVHPVPFCVMCFSVDGLFSLRERYGQAAIDATLRVVAQTLEKALRPTDFIGRWLDQEFLAILTECTENELIKVAARLRKMVQMARIPWWGDTIRVSISVGSTPVLDNDTVGSLVERAELALRESNAPGGNHAVIVSR